MAHSQFQYPYLPPSLSVTFTFLSLLFSCYLTEFTSVCSLYSPWHLHEPGISAWQEIFWVVCSLPLWDFKMGFASELPSAHASSELKMQSQSVSPDWCYEHTQYPKMAPYFCIIRGFDYLAAQMGMQDVRLSRVAPCLFSSKLCSASEAEGERVSLCSRANTPKASLGAPSASSIHRCSFLFFWSLRFWASVWRSVQLCKCSSVSFKRVGSGIGDRNCNCFFFCCCFDFETGDPLGQATLNSLRCWEWPLNSRSSCLHLPSARITEKHHFLGLCATGNGTPGPREYSTGILPTEIHSLLSVFGLWMYLFLYTMNFIVTWAHFETSWTCLLHKAYYPLTTIGTVWSFVRKPAASEDGILAISLWPFLHSLPGARTAVPGCRKIWLKWATPFTLLPR